MGEPCGLRLLGRLWGGNRRARRRGGERVAERGSRIAEVALAMSSRSALLGGLRNGGVAGCGYGVELTATPWWVGVFVTWLLVQCCNR